MANGAPMTFLQLAQSAAVNCGISGAITTCQNPIGEAARLIGWVNDAWNDIQTEHPDWSFMRSSVLLGNGCIFATVAGQADYPLGTNPGECNVDPTNFGMWDEYSFRNYSTATGFTNEMFMDPISFDDWRDSYMLGAMRNVESRPVVVAFGPQQEVLVGPPSDGTWTVVGDYFFAPSKMVADADTPLYLPQQFHMLIVYRLMKLKYGLYEAAAEVIERGMKEHDRMLSELEALRGQRMYLGKALA